MPVGQYLNQVLFPALIDRGKEVWSRIHPPGSPDLAGMFDGQFSQLPQHAYMWLVIGAPKNVVSQLLTGFTPQWIVGTPPERILVRSRRQLPAATLADLRTRDGEHEAAGRITWIPSSHQHSYVFSGAARFPIYQLQDDLSEKLRVIFNARILNFRLPARKFSLPTVRSLANDLKGWFISIDLSKAYFQIPMDWQSRKYFSAFFADQEEAFVFNSWPFGVSSAPSLCTFLVQLW